MLSFIAFVFALIATGLSYLLGLTAVWWLLLIIFFGTWLIVWIILRLIGGDGLRVIGDIIGDIFS